MEKSESIKNLAVALIKAQAELKIVEKEANNSYFKSRYADLPAIDKEYKRVFPKYGLVVTQLVEGMGLVTILAHESGEYLLSVATLNPTKNDPQGLGSAITYMRRYALAAVCGIVSSEDDDDGNHASEPGKHEPAKTEAKPAPAPAAQPTAKRIIGKILAKQDSGMGFVSYKIKDFTFSTKKGELIDAMDAIHAKDGEAQVDYNEVVKGKFTNRYIEKVTEVEPLPF